MLVTIQKTSCNSHKDTLNKIALLPGVKEIIPIESSKSTISILLHGDYSKLSCNAIKQLPNVIDISIKNNLYPLLARPKNNNNNFGFNYMGINFSQDSFNIFAGFNTIDTTDNHLR